MRHYSRYLILAGGVISFVCFALPWKHNFSGAVLANGKGWSVTLPFAMALMIIGTSIYLLKHHLRFSGRTLILALLMGCLGLLLSTVTLIQVVEQALNFVTISFVSSLAIVGFSLYLFDRTSVSDSIPRLGVFICSIVGLCCFLLLFFSGSYVIGSGSRVDNTRYGAFLTAIGYMTAIIGFLSMENTTVNSVESLEEENERNHDVEGDGE